MSEETKGMIIWGLAILGGVAAFIADKNESGEWDVATLFASGFVSLMAAWGLVSIVARIIGPPGSSSASKAQLQRRDAPSRPALASPEQSVGVLPIQLEDLKEQRHRNLSVLAKELAAATASEDDTRRVSIEFLTECTRGDLHVLALPQEEMKWLVEFCVKEIFPWYRYWTAVAGADGQHQPALWANCVTAYGEVASNNASGQVHEAIAQGIDYWTAAGSNVPVTMNGRSDMEVRFPGLTDRFIKTCWFMTDETAKGVERG